VADPAEVGELGRLAQEAARRAVELDPLDAEAHSVLSATFIGTGERAQAAAELRRSLELNPSSADILTFYAPFASLLGEPERGAEAADRAIRLNPNLPLWANENYSEAYFWVGRYEDALSFRSRLPEESRGLFDHVIIAVSLDALGRKEEAAGAVRKALATDPAYSVEEEAGWPGYDDATRARIVKAMLGAGFPPCADPERLAGIPPAKRLPACASEPTG
jgi:tetratricopeptide (TPR) repeat protein